MNAEQLASLKRINAAAAAQKQNELSPLAIKVVFGLLAAVGCFFALSFIAKGAGL